MSSTSWKVISAFSKEHAVRLIEVSSSKRVTSPFKGQPNVLLKVLRKSESSYIGEKDTHAEKMDSIDENKTLEGLAQDFYRFKKYWDRTRYGARSDIGFFAAEKLGREFEDVIDDMHEALDMVGIGIKVALERQDKGDCSRPHNRPGLQAFVEHIYLGYKQQGPCGDFGDEFEGGNDGDDRVPVSPAAKLGNL